MDGRLPLVKRLVGAGRRRRASPSRRRGTWDDAAPGPAARARRAPGRDGQAGRRAPPRRGWPSSSARTPARSRARWRSSSPSSATRKAIDRRRRRRERDAGGRGSLLRARERRRGARPAPGARRCWTGAWPTAPAPFMMLGSLAGDGAAPHRRARARPEGGRRPAHRDSFDDWQATVLPQDPRGGARREEAVRVLDEVPGGAALRPRASSSTALAGLAEADLAHEDRAGRPPAARARAVAPDGRQPERRIVSERVLVTSALPYANGPHPPRATSSSTSRPTSTCASAAPAATTSPTSAPPTRTARPSR